MSAAFRGFRRMSTGTITTSRNSSRDNSRSAVKRKATSILLTTSPRSSPTKLEFETHSESQLVQFTPPDQVIPHTGGRYEDWEFHPSRLQALREELESEKSDRSAAAGAGESVFDSNTSDEDDTTLRDRWSRTLVSHSTQQRQLRLTEYSPERRKAMSP